MIPVLESQIQSLEQALSQRVLGFDQATPDFQQQLAGWSSEDDQEPWPLGHSKQHDTQVSGLV